MCNVFEFSKRLGFGFYTILFEAMLMLNIENVESNKKKGNLVLQTSLIVIKCKLTKSKYPWTYWYWIIVWAGLC